MSEIPMERVPWPSRQRGWEFGSWKMKGLAVTAWMDFPRDLASEIASASLLRPGSGPIRGRVRFYDLTWKSVTPSQDSELNQGHFREAVIAFDTQHRGIFGETGVYMWADSEVYIMWARELFGFPVRKGRVLLDYLVGIPESPGIGNELTFSLDVDDKISLSLHARLEAVDVDRESTTEAVWITPRERPDIASRTIGRDVLSVRPRYASRGTLFSAKAAIHAAFASSHPLADWQPVITSADALFGVEVVVGDRVDVLPHSD